MLRPWALRNPSDAEARLVAANLAVQLERADDAIQLLSGMPESDPAIRLLHGKALVLKKDGPGAVALLTPLLANHPAGDGPRGAALPRRGPAAGRPAGRGHQADRRQDRGAPRARAAPRPRPAPGRQRRRRRRHPEAAGRQAPRERQRDRRSAPGGGDRHGVRRAAGGRREGRGGGAVLREVDRLLPAQPRRLEGARPGARRRRPQGGGPEGAGPGGRAGQGPRQARRGPAAPARRPPLRRRRRGAAR